MFARSRTAAAAVLMLVCLAGGPARATELVVEVAGPQGAAADAVVSLHSPQAAAAVRPAEAVIDQRDTQFVPRVSVIETGSRVRFPNSDNVRHQVYSFSPAKRFELPLYSGQAAAPVTFDQPGVIELGCNIHDWMVAYVVVVDTPYHGITDAAGRAVLNAPPGRYRLRVWHTDQPAGQPPHEEDIEIGAQRQERRVRLALTERIVNKPPVDEKLRALQEKFRKLKRGG